MRAAIAAHIVISDHKQRSGEKDGGCKQPVALSVKRFLFCRLFFMLCRLFSPIRGWGCAP